MDFSALYAGIARRGSSEQETSLTAKRVSSKDQSDGRDDLPQNPHAFDKVVLAHLPYGHGQSRRIDF